eukprot:symbB.v1.2.023845.t1/scaffold2213.1/size114990/6
MKKDLDGTKKALADATAVKANAEGEVAVCEQDIKTAKEFLVQVERGCMEKAGQFQQQKKNREDEVKAIMGALKALRGVMNSKGSKSAVSFLQLASGRWKDLHHLALRKVQELSVAMKSHSQFSSLRTFCLGGLSAEPACLQNERSGTVWR